MSVTLNILEVGARGDGVAEEGGQRYFVPFTLPGEIVEAVARLYLDPLLATVPRPKCLVLGCTHFPVLKGVIANIAGDDVVLVDSAAATAAAVEVKLRDAGLANASGAAPSHAFLVTDAPDRFARVGEIFLCAPIDPGRVELIDLQ